MDRNTPPETRLIMLARTAEQALPVMWQNQASFTPEIRAVMHTLGKGLSGVSVSVQEIAALTDEKNITRLANTGEFKGMEIIGELAKRIGDVRRPLQENPAMFSQMKDLDDKVSKGSWTERATKPKGTPEVSPS